MIFITAIHLKDEGTSHQDIEQVRWITSDDTQRGIADVSEIVDYIRSGKRVSVRTKTLPMSVCVVEDEDGASYLQAGRRGIWTADLLALPSF